MKCPRCEMDTLYLNPDGFCGRCEAVEVKRTTWRRGPKRKNPKVNELKFACVRKLKKVVDI